jgi:IclR family acetate operon transcriptional repressor
MFALRMSGSVGQTAPLHCTALGKAMLAWLPATEAESLVGEEPFRQNTDRTLTTWSALGAELAGVRHRGFAVEVEEMDVGASCIGAPILNAHGRPVAALSVSAFIARMGEKDRAVNGELLVQWCRRISHALGHDPQAAGRPDAPAAGAVNGGRSADPAPAAATLTGPAVDSQPLSQ